MNPLIEYTDTKVDKVCAEVIGLTSVARDCAILDGVPKPIDEVSDLDLPGRHPLVKFQRSSLARLHLVGGFRRRQRRSFDQRPGNELRKTGPTCSRVEAEGRIIYHAQDPESRARSVSPKRAPHGV